MRADPDFVARTFQRDIRAHIAKIENTVKQQIADAAVAIPPLPAFHETVERLGLMHGHGLADTGAREVHSTGAVREPRPVEKGRYDLISPIGEHRLAVHYARGAVKYSPGNMRKGLPLSRFLCSAKSHMNDLLKGKTDEDHAAALCWNIFEFMHTLDRIEAGKLPRSLDDRAEMDPIAFEVVLGSDVTPCPTSVKPTTRATRRVNSRQAAKVARSRR